MVLDNSKLGAPWHLQFYDPDTRRLCYMLLLPLFDGVFATLLISGYTQSVTGILNVAFTVFAGAGALTVIYSEAETRENARKMVLKVSPVLLIAGALTGILAPAFESFLHLETLKIISGLAVAAIALQIADVKYSEKIPVPLLILFGMAISLQPTSNLIITLEYIIPSLATISIALTGLYIASGLENYVNIDYMRKGGVAVLLLISASLLGANIPSEVGLAMLAVSLGASIRY